MHTIGLTSPHTKGADVTKVQQLLKKNWTGRDFLQGKVDGDFGPESGRGCIRAKYWLGYATAAQKPVAGDDLVRLLSGANDKVLPLALRLRRNARLRKQTQKPLRALALERAEKDLGMKESPPESNRCPITARWGIVGAWCCEAVSIWYIDAGSKAFREHVDWAYVPPFLQAAELGLRGIALIPYSLVEPGDAVCFDWDKDGVPDHVGLVRAIGKKGGFSTIEGNTAVGNDSNGGQVMHRERTLGNVATYHGAPAFVRISR